MGFFVLGINHKDCPVEVREKMHFSTRMLQEALEKGKRSPEISELVILSTCNRVEFHGFSEQDAIPEDTLAGLIEEIHLIERQAFAPYFYRHQGKEAVRHLFRVAAGLDSLVVGENEILGQVRDAFRQANAVETVHSLLYRLMEKAIKLGKDVRTKTKINEGAVSIPSVAVELAEKIFGKLRGEKVMVLGAGEMSMLALENLRQAGADALYVVSRSEERGNQVSARFDAEWIPFETWENYLVSTDILIASTSAPHPLVRVEQVRKAMSARRNRPLLLVDIAVPRNIESPVEDMDNVYLYNIDDLKGVSAANLRLRRREVHAAEGLVAKAVDDYQGWLERLKARPVMERFEKFVDDVLEKELEVLTHPSALSEEEKQAVRHRIRAKLLHPPHAKIKEASENGGVRRYLEALHSLFDLDKK